ncbi:MAG: hypothetical protein U9N77_09135 [Thermodesulfobacteriota bacterium]|nr:hypothetical protein [Thermodesulfobacteriota bacterium]
MNMLKNLGKTVIAITHDMDFCADHFDRAVVMHRGKVLMDGPAQRVFYHGEPGMYGTVIPPQITSIAQKAGFHQPVRDLEENNIRILHRPICMIGLFVFKAR